MQRKLLIRSVIMGILFLVFYFTIVIVTTPNFPPQLSITIALSLNGIYILGGVVSVSIQTWIIEYSKTIPFQLGLPKSRRFSSRLLNILASAVSAFFSFFALIGVGCCGTWLFILSLLPGILGVGATAFLIEYNTILAQLGLLLMAISNIHAGINLRKKLKFYKEQQKKLELTSLK